MKRLAVSGRLLASCLLLPGPLGVVAGSVPASGQAAPEAAGFAISDQNPFLQIHSLPWPVEPVTPGAGQWSLGWTLDSTNHAIEAIRDDGERIVIDGETWRSSLRIGYGVSPALTADVTIPVVSHQRGIFDGFIRDWHDLFGLSNSRRNGFDDGSLRYEYRDAAGNGVEVREPGTGIGDIRFSAAWRLPAGDRQGRRYALRAGLKLPTGSASRLHGSGGTDLSLQLSALDRRTFAKWKTTLSWMAGVLWLGDGEVLEDLRRDVAAIGTLGFARPVFVDRLFLKAQVDAHTSFYDTAFDEIGSGSVQLIIGAGYRPAPHYSIEIGVVENLFTDTTPDFVLHLALHTLI